MKRILLVMYNALDKGGIQNVMMNIVRSLSKEYVFDALVLSEKKGFYDEEFLSFGGKLFKKDLFRRQNVFLNKIKFYLRGRFICKNIKRIIEKNGPYIAVHCHIADEAGIALLAAKRCGVPIRIAHAHTSFDSKYNPIAKLYIAHLRKLIRKNATDLVACSEKAGKRLFENEKFDVVYNTVDEKFFKRDRDHKINDAPALLQVGMICDNKNQAFSIKVLAELKKRYPDSRLTFIGGPKDGEMQKYFDSVKKLAEDNGLCDSVTFLPADSDVKEEMNNCSYVLFPSRFEGLGIVPIEAQAQGVRCFVSDSISQEIDCGGCVFLNLNDGAAVWAEHIAEQFEKDHGERENYDTSRFSPDVIMDKYRKIYNGEKSKNE